MFGDIDWPLNTRRAVCQWLLNFLWVILLSGRQSWNMTTSTLLIISILFALKIKNTSNINKLYGRPPQYAPTPCKLTFDPLTLKVVSESHVTWATSVSILVFLGLSVLDLGPMYATYRQTSDRPTSDAHHRLMPPPYGGGGVIKRKQIS